MSGGFLAMPTMQDVNRLEQRIAELERAVAALQADPNVPITVGCAKGNCGCRPVRAYCNWCGSLQLVGHPCGRNKR